MPAKDPQAVALTDMLLSEAKQDGPKLADLLFGQHAFTDSRNVKRPEYLRFVQHAWLNGIQVNGQLVPPEVWRAKFLERVGEERFWKDAHEAFGLSPAQGLDLVKQASQPAEPEPPPEPPEETT